MTTNQSNHPAEPVALYGFLTPKDGHREQLLDLLAELVEPSRSRPGSLVYRLHEQEDGRIFLYELWASREDLAAHHATQVLKDVLERLPEHLAGAPEVYEGQMYGEPAGSHG
ncbi:putative quinol monooxygenase [Kitasatospora griseola]